MRNILFDICSIPIYILILWTCRARRISKDHASRVFIMMNGISLACAVLDVAMELVVNPLPLSAARVVSGHLISYGYLVLRNATLVLYLIYVFAATRTEYKIRPLPMRLLVWTPNTVLLALLVQNLFTHTVFDVTSRGGYARGPLMLALYVIAALYGIVGAAYTIHAKKYLPAGKWVALISVYVLTFIAVFIQLMVPYLLVEMFSTAVGLLMIMLLVMRPEETIDASVDIASWKAYQEDLRNVLQSGQRVQIVVIRLVNAAEIRSYIGEDEYNNYVMILADALEKLVAERRIDANMYFERPGSIYLMIEDMALDVPALMVDFEKASHERIQKYTNKGVRSDPRVCVIRCPDDLNDFRDIVNLGHRFVSLGGHDQIIHIADKLIHSRDYEVTNHIDEILNRIITEGTLRMYYQPIYDIKKRAFRSAEALARVNDTKYGMIPPGVFIPAAENNGLMLPIGDIILENVFKFISENDLSALGLSYIEINLSVAQCLQRELPEIVKKLQRKYNVDPKQVNFEVTETMFDNLSSVMDQNLRELAGMGYTFSLDDYGIGYSNIQRLRSLPLRIIKIDKSLVDDMFTADGEVIIENTVRMMKGIHKELVVEGVETEAAIDACNALSCDFIQGFYYSKPLPEEDFLRFLNARRAARTEP